MLALEGVGRRFRGGGGVEGLSLRVTAGEIVALIGLNGAGKTTLMRLALGMLRPRSGVVRLLGHALADLPQESWGRVGALIEMPPAYPELTVRRNLEMNRLLRGAPSHCVEQALAAWRLEPVAHRRVRRLSQGNRQRTGLAAALQHDPKLIVLDEPSSTLDPASVIVLREQLVRRAGEGAAILVSSHHLDEVARVANRVVLMNAGRLIGELELDGGDLEHVFFERIRLDDARHAVAGRSGR